MTVWKDISTAPKGQWILLARVGGDYPMVGKSYYRGGFIGTDESAIWPEPTHWTELPPPPDNTDV
jgi:hypothetical protein